MAVIAGIDEAGFGPILGPLVVTSVMFDVPADLVGVDLWKILEPAVSKRARKRDARLAIGDSKKLYSPSEGLARLERGVLGSLALVSTQLEGLRSMLGWLCPDVVGQMDGYSWYRQADVALPTAADATALRLGGKGLASVMKAAGVHLTSARSEVLLVGQYNRLTAATNNKATTLLDHTCRLIDRVWRCRPAGQEVTILVDRQGGRVHYLPALGRTFPGAGAKKILTETPAHSGYRITLGDTDLQVHFIRRGEDMHLPIALASMISKYVRELFMLLFNRCWAAQVPGGQLKPTAGYTTDGERFLTDIDQARSDLNTPADLLVRCR